MEPEYAFTAEELARIAEIRRRYPTARAALMPVLWMAQEKFGWLSREVIELVAQTLSLNPAEVYGVATFYTMYHTQACGRYVLDLCTCLSCQVLGAEDLLRHLEERLGVRDGQTTPDGLFTVRHTECLGACGSGPVLMINNRRYVHRLSQERLDQLIEELRQGRMPEFASIPLPERPWEQEASSDS
ncbi:MAG: NADH-quinone oxidoreductase subunit NuoE [Bacteroidetes bacterium]|nr:NADH-quinone oxidoreductase subunit NuoE [Rhodothermia bacterium]MCS7155242.1 NADH-quinone oxidoreductase subunit NuoE [Bacteroidota bacterium]MCX7907827.1 NADH-quinone oxidoreductase subunit NuoE [Bacteroidota bacterium]MDW8138646.1 NADH-quinone oxidoreductase subunit NuoE [Bacteroidota bacterium]MDW8284768.1 NADH-quinone oxidoreductase subunit NuoE [Bacteroidota bacterium]